jgi:hypothetical protein
LSSLGASGDLARRADASFGLFFNFSFALWFDYISLG